MRLRQVLLDVGLVVWVFVWVWIGFWLNDLVQRLEGPGRSIEDAGDQIAGWSVPILDRRLGPITSGGEALQRAGEAQQDVVHSLAFWLALLLAAIPIVWLMARYVPGRLRWAREATAASRIRAEPSATQLFALRAMANRPLTKLRRVECDPAAAYSRADYGALASLELAELGLQPLPRAPR